MIAKCKVGMVMPMVWHSSYAKFKEIIEKIYVLLFIFQANKQYLNCFFILFKIKKKWQNTRYLKLYFYNFTSKLLKKT